MAPLVEHRVVRALLEDAAALGVQIATGKCKPAHKMLRQMGAACSAAVALLAVQRSLCVEEGVLMLTWFEAVSQLAITKLMRGKWDIAGEMSGSNGISLPRTETLDLSCGATSQPLCCLRGTLTRSCHRCLRWLSQLTSSLTNGDCV